MNIELEYFINNNIRFPMYSKFMLLQNIQKILLLYIIYKWVSKVKLQNLFYIMYSNFIEYRTISGKI